jgi:hypothetical protein
MNKADYVDLGLACADVCKALDEGMKGRRVDELSQSVLEAVEHLTTSVKLAEMRLVHSLLTVFSIVGPWRRSRRGSSRMANEIYSPDSSMRRTTKKRSSPGGWTSTGSFTSSTCVQSIPFDNR